MLDLDDIEPGARECMLGAHRYATGNVAGGVWGGYTFVATGDEISTHPAEEMPGKVGVGSGAAFKPDDKTGPLRTILAR